IGSSDGSPSWRWGPSCWCWSWGSSMSGARGGSGGTSQSIVRPGGSAVACWREMRPPDVWETASFYTMYHFRPVGRCHIEVCHNLSCPLLGAESLLDHLKGRLRIGG